MFARLTTYDLDEGRASESASVFESAIDQIRDLDGFVDGYFMVDRDGGRAVTLTLWQSLDTMERSRVTASRARTEAANEVGATVTSTYEYDVTLHAGAQTAGAQDIS
jgi:heme-degrading monooxygenase HmoA